MAVFPDDLQAEHSPVSYFLGGLGAMLGLIALALLILACANWKLSEGDNGAGGGNDDLERSSASNSELFEHKKIHVVIMAGENTPTFLATSVAA